MKRGLLFCTGSRLHLCFSIPCRTAICCDSISSACATVSMSSAATRLHQIMIQALGQRLPPLRTDSLAKSLSNQIGAGGEIAGALATVKQCCQGFQIVVSTVRQRCLLGKPNRAANGADEHSEEYAAVTNTLPVAVARH